MSSSRWECASLPLPSLPNLSRPTFMVVRLRSPTATNAGGHFEGHRNFPSWDLIGASVGYALSVVPPLAISKPHIISAHRERRQVEFRAKYRRNPPSLAAKRDGCRLEPRVRISQSIPTASRS